MDSLLRSMSEDDVAAVSQGGYRYLARHPDLILHACPNLEELHVTWDSRACCNVHIFDDTFFETLASTCRWLRTLHIGQVAHFAYLGSDAPETTGRISDSLLSVLGMMGRLRDVRVYGLHVGGKGLVNLMRGCSPDHAKPGLHVKIRTRESAEADVFYGTVRSALGRLLTCRGDALQCRRSISVDIRNTCHDASYLVGTESIKKLLSQVRALYPTARISVFVDHSDGHGGGAMCGLQINQATQAPLCPGTVAGDPLVLFLEDQVSAVASPLSCILLPQTI